MALLASRIVHRRTTISAPGEVLDTLAAEAKRRGVSLNAILAEAVGEKAAGLRAARRPRLGLGTSTDGRAAATVAAEPVAHPPAG
jgi:hypothetical protein